ncbi:hypothetical protein [uncultured Sphingomonas sp.]|uniref:hypothetical protein n=1 Tax=uncultured Sphingomonas sp. TaxID=158754 RepID=UPI0025FE9DFB|nr:hypothetical protein [uncultured Sphingomonas sp.]
MADVMMLADASKAAPIPIRITSPDIDSAIIFGGGQGGQWSGRRPCPKRRAERLPLSPCAQSVPSFDIKQRKNRD